MSAIDENLLKLHKCTMKRENQSEKRSFGRKKLKRKMLAQLTHTGGCVTKKG
jgi:hypothetical protein